MTEHIEDLKLRKSELNSLIFCILVVLLQMFGIDMYIPSMPYIAMDLHASQTIIQLTVAFYLLGAALTALFSGPLSDKIGRKPTIIVGIVGMLIGAFVCLFSTSGYVLLAGRLIQGIGAGFCMSANRAVITDVFSAKKLAVVGTYFSILLAVSPVIAPVVGGYLEHYYNWRANFVVLAFAYALVLILFIFMFKETNQHLHDEKLSLHFILTRFRYLLGKYDFVAYAICAGLAIGVSIAYATAATYIFQNMLHVSPVAFGWLGVFVAVGNILGRITSGKLIKYYSMQDILNMGIAIIIFAGIFLSAFTFFSLLSVAICLISIVIALIGQTFVMSNAFALSMTPYRHMGGAANALLSFGQMALSFVVSSLISFSSKHMLEVNALSSSYLCIGIVCALIVLPIFLKKESTQ